MSKCLFCEKPTRMSERTNRPLKYCSKKCANDFYTKKNSSRREGWGDAYKETLKLREERKKEYERVIEEGWIEYRELAGELGLTPPGLQQRIRRCLTEGVDTKKVHNGERGAQGYKRYVSPAGAEKLRNYDLLDLPPGPKQVLTEEQKEKYKKQRLARYQTEEYKARNRKRFAEKRKDPKYRLRCAVGSAVYNALKKAGNIKIGPTFASLPYGPEELCAYLEKQFDEHMTWENYGSYWHLDHIQPQASLPYETTKCKNFKKCWALSNLQPLEARKNSSKGSYHEGKRYTWKKIK